MAKNIRWQIPFVSLSGVHYRIDIYDEESQEWDAQNPVQLTGGTNPFVTSEDDSDDYFAPIRTQTGTIEVCTLMPDGNYITLDDLLPANNIARPVRLINRDNSDAIEWQGFLSCEAYSQDYTGIPQNIDLPVISVLEAMDSVQLDQNRNTGLQNINVALFYILDEIHQQCDVNMPMFTHINYSTTDWRIFEKKIDNTILFDKKDYTNVNRVVYVLSGISAKDALARLCTFMGWVAREKGSEIYLERIDEQYSMTRKALGDFKTSATPSSVEELIVSNISDLTWVGVNHKKDVRQGAKCVMVNANIQKSELDLGIPDFSKAILVANQLDRWSTWGEFHAVPQNDTFSDIEIKSHEAVIYLSEVIGEDGSISIFQGIDETNYDETIPYKNIEFYTDYVDIIEGTKTGNYSIFTTAFFGNAKNPYVIPNDEVAEGVMIVGVPTRLYHDYEGTLYQSLEVSPTIEENDYIYKHRSITYFRASSGYIKITLKAVSILTMGAYYGKNSNAFRDSVDVSITIALRWGNKWLHYVSGTGYFFNTVFSTVEISIDENGEGPNNWHDPNENKDGLFIQVDSEMTGEVSLYIYPTLTGVYGNAGHIRVPEAITGILFEEFNVEYEPIEDETLSEDQSNRYLNMLGTNFRDEITISTELATSQNNPPSPSLIMNDAMTPASSIDYTVSGGTESRRPEVDLLNRLASYYGAARQRLELEVAHPTAAPLPLLKMNGINDGKVYLPLSESRDWQTDVCKLQCFELPQ